MKTHQEVSDNLSHAHPFSWEIEFYRKNNIPMWETFSQVPVNIGKIYSNGASWIEAEVTCMPAQFWKFKVFCGDSGKTYEISTGSGCLMYFFDTVKNIADDMIDIEVLSQTKRL